MELNENDLEKVLGGNSQNMGEELAKENPDLFRQKKIEELKIVKEELKNNSELTEEELSNIKAGFSR